MMTDERRRRIRVPVRLETKVLTELRQTLVTSKNISLKGMLCTGAGDFEPGRECVAVIELTDEIKVEIKGRVVRSDSEELAIDFTEMDEVSFYHLKKIIGYNADDPDRVDSELSRPAFHPRQT
jgi:hypothetical protein